jgi:cytochrome c biogenesis protein
LTLAFTSKATGMIYEEKAAVGQTIKLPESLGQFTVNELRNDFKFRGQDLGATIVGTLLQSDGTSVEVTLPVKFPSFDKMGSVFNKTRKDDLFISVSNIKAPAVEQRYFTGLQVSRDPGVWVVYTGFILIIVGCYITFFMSHRQVCIDIIVNDPLHYKGISIFQASYGPLPARPQDVRIPDELTLKFKNRAVACVCRATAK